MPPQLTTTVDDDFSPSVYVPIVHPMGLYHTLWTKLDKSESSKWGVNKPVEECTPEEKQEILIFQFNVINDPAKPFLDKEETVINKRKFVDASGEERDMVLTIRATKTYSTGGKGRPSTLTVTLNGLVGRTLSKEEAGTLSLKKFFVAGYHPADILLGIEEKDGEKFNKVMSVQRTPIFRGKAISSVDITPFLLSGKVVQAIRDDEMKDHFEDQ